MYSVHLQTYLTQLIPTALAAVIFDLLLEIVQYLHSLRHSIPHTCRKMARRKQTPLQMKKAPEKAPMTSPKKRTADEADTESFPSPVKRRTTAGLPRAAETESNAVSYGRLDDNPDVSQPFSPPNHSPLRSFCLTVMSKKLARSDVFLLFIRTCVMDG